MSFWQELQLASSVNNVIGWIVLAFLFIAIVLYALLPRERAKIRTASLIFIISLFSLVLAATLSYRGQHGRAYVWAKWASLLLQRTAFVSLASIFLFDIVLTSIRLRPPRIMRDLIVALAYILVAIGSLQGRLRPVRGVPVVISRLGSAARTDRLHRCRWHRMSTSHRCAPRPGPRHVPAPLRNGAA